MVTEVTDRVLLEVYTVHDAASKMEISACISSE